MSGSAGGAGARFLPLPFAGSGWHQIVDELLQVAFVVAQRVRADVAFVAQVIEKLRTKMS